MPDSSSELPDRVAPERSARSPRPAAEAVLVLRGLRAGYPRWLGLATREVLHGLNFELGWTRRLGLVGPNGSGKSTLLCLLAGLDRPSSGAIEVFGERPDRASVRRRVGYLPEDSPFPRDLRAAVALELLGTLKGLGRREARTRGLALLGRVGLAAHARTPLGRFSRGMLRRFGLAQAVLHAPDLLLLDEPAAGLDAEGFAVLQELLDEAVARGARLILSSHLAGEVLADCERLVCLVDGRLVADAEPDSLLAAPGGLIELYRAHAPAAERAT